MLIAMTTTYGSNRRCNCLRAWHRTPEREYRLTIQCRLRVDRQRQLLLLDHPEIEFRREAQSY